EVKISADKTPEDIAKEVSNILDPLEAKSYGSKIFSSIYLAIKDPRYGFAKSSKEDVFKLIIIVTDGFDYSDDPLIREARMTFEGSNYEENVSLLCPEEERMRKIGGCREVRKEDIISALEEEGVTLYVVDYSKKMREPLATFTPMNDPNNLGEITDATGGRRILASNDREVRSAFEKITETISRTYVVYFYPTEGFTGINRYDRRVEIGYIDKNDEFKKYDYRIYTAERYVVR
ncbi:MAG: hypothetical protein Q8P49_04185, partial [Candidatus Liptonbacteria bacterium]|nr:hypothetical protein [Candidatus Liptonbacteria bacterium]